MREPIRLSSGIHQGAETTLPVIIGARVSWDVSIMKFARPVKSLDELTDDDRPVSLGARADVHAAVSAVFGGTDWSDPAWGRWESAHGSIEFNVGSNDPLESMMMHVRAEPAVVPLILDLCEANRWQAIDISEGEIMTRDGEPEKGIEAWRSFRDHVIDGSKPKS